MAATNSFLVSNPGGIPRLKLSVTCSQAYYVGSLESSPVTGYALLQNYPNPFYTSTVVRYALPRNSFVNPEVYNSIGQRVAVLADGMMEAGYHEIAFNVLDLASGVYLYRLQTGEYVATRRLLLLR